MKYNFEIKNYEYIETNSDGIDSDRYIIQFILVKIDKPPLEDQRTKHIITVEIKGSLLTIENLWNCSRSEIPKVAFAHAFEYIKSLIIEKKLSKKIYLELDKAHLLKFHIDSKKVPEINNYNFDFEINDPPKVFGFRLS